MKIIMCVVIAALIMPAFYRQSAASPCDLLSIDGTVWQSAYADDLTFAFNDGNLYVDCQWMERDEGECENMDLVPIDPVIRETGRIGFSIHFSTPFATHIFRLEVRDLEDNSGYMEGWYIVLWPWRFNPFFRIAPDLVEKDKPRGIGVCHHYAYSSSWEDIPPVLLFKVDDSWSPQPLE